MEPDLYDEWDLHGSLSLPYKSHSSYKSYKSHRSYRSHNSHRLVGLSVLFAVIEAGAGHLLAYASLGEKLLLLAVDESPQHICGLLNKGDSEVGRLFIRQTCDNIVIV